MSVVTSPVLVQHYVSEQQKFLDWLETRVEMLPDAPGCWIWMGARFGWGHAMVMWPGLRQPQGVHRIVYGKLVGPIPLGLFVLHKCNVPPCVRPTHLYVGTQLQNMQDRMKRPGGYDSPSLRRLVTAGGKP